MREVAAQRADGGRESLLSFSPQVTCGDSPLVRGALGRYHPYTHVLVNHPDTGYGIFIENMLNAAG